MAIESQKYKGTQETIPVGGLNTTLSQTVAADASTTAKAADHIVQIQDVDGAGCWFLIGDSGDTLAPAADTGAFIPPYGITRPFTLKAGKVVEANAKINLQFCDVEE